MPHKTYDPGVAEGRSPPSLYSVQKSRSLGVVSVSQTDSSPSQSPVPPEQGRRTPNLGSLRKKFSKKKANSVEEDPDYSSSSWKKKNKHKVGNFFKWFKKDKEDISETETLSPKLTRIIQKPSEAPQRILVAAPLRHRSSSYDSLCSVGSATSSFAFVPVNHYQVGRAVESKKRIAISTNCGAGTYRARMEERQKVLEADREVDLAVKYNLVPSDSPPTLRRGTESYSAVPGPSLPAGPLLPFGRARSPGSDTDDTLEMESVSQRESPDPQGGQVQDTGMNRAWPIKPREMTGQLLHPMTIKFTPEQAKNALMEIGIESENGTLKYSPARSAVAPPGLVTGGSAVKPESLPNIWREPGSPGRRTQPQSSNPFGDTVSLAATLPLQRRSAASPRSSISGDELRVSHAPGKRRAPAPPLRPTSPAVSEGSALARPRSGEGLNPFLGARRKGPAPRPPAMLERQEQYQNGDSQGTATQPVLAGSQVHGQVQEVQEQGGPVSSPLPQEWVLQDGVLRSLRDSRSDLAPSPLPTEEQREVVKVPLSPKPWYKRATAKDSPKPKGKEDRGKKSRTPENLPEIHTSRDTIKLRDTIEEKYSQFVKISRENLMETPKSPKQFLRSKIMPSSPKLERPSSRPISGLMGISDLDRQAAEIIRKKNEDESARRKAQDERFYTDANGEDDTAQKALDIIMENVSLRMQNMDNKQTKPADNKLLDERLKGLETKAAYDEVAKSDAQLAFAGQDRPGPALSAGLHSGIPTQNVLNSPFTQQTAVPSHKDSSKVVLEVRPCDLNRAEGFENRVILDGATTTATMDTVVSDLNSFLASTRKAMSSPAAQKRLLIVQQAKEQSKLLTASVAAALTTAKDQVQSITAQPNDFGKVKLQPKGAGKEHEKSRIERVEEAVSHAPTRKLITNGNSFPSLSATEPGRPLEYSSSLPPPPTPAPLPPLAVERTDGWACPRCTLLNYNAQLWCEACGGKRAGPAVEPQQGEEEEEEEGPPRPGNVLNKMVLFSGLEARANETPSLTRRRSTDASKLLRTYSTAAMVPIEESPLARTFNRITESQAQLGSKSSEFPGPSTTCSPVLQKKDTHKDIIREQERLLDQARANIQAENTSTLPSKSQLSNNPSPSFNAANLVKRKEGEVHGGPCAAQAVARDTGPQAVVALLDTHVLVQCKLSSETNPQAKLSDIPPVLIPKGKQTEPPLKVQTKVPALPNKSAHPILPTQVPAVPNKITNHLQIDETKPDALTSQGPPSSPVKRASSFKGSFDFTKTPSAFLSSRSNIPRFTTSVSEGFKLAGQNKKEECLDLQASQDLDIRKIQREDKKHNMQSTTFETSDTNLPVNKFDLDLAAKSAITSTVKIPDKVVFPCTDSQVKDNLDKAIKESANSLHISESKSIENRLGQKVNGNIRIRNQDKSENGEQMRHLREQQLEEESRKLERKMQELKREELEKAEGIKEGQKMIAKTLEEQRWEEQKREQLEREEHKVEEQRKFEKRREEQKKVEKIRQDKMKQLELLELERKLLAEQEEERRKSRSLEERQNKRLEEDAKRSKRIQDIAQLKRQDDEAAMARIEARKESVPRLHFLGSEVTKSQRQTGEEAEERRRGSINVLEGWEEGRGAGRESRDTASVPQARLDFFSTPVKRRSTSSMSGARESGSRLSLSRDPLAPKIPPKKEPYYASPVSPPRPVTPPRPTLPRPHSTLSYREESPPPRPDPPAALRTPMTKRQTSRLSSAYDWDPSRARSTTPLALARQASFTSQPGGSYGRGRYSSDSPDSDYPPWNNEVERALSRIGTTSLDTEAYSAMTPIVNRKQSVSSVHSTPLLQPKVSKDFGFISSKKEPIPKPPRRTRSKDPSSSMVSMPSSRDITPVNSPVRPVRGTRGRASVQGRPLSQCQDTENVYEVLTPGPLPPRTRTYSSSSDSDSDFRTPRASPRFVRPSQKQKAKPAKVQSSPSKGSMSSSKASISSSKVPATSKQKVSPASKMKPSSSVIMRDQGQSYQNTEQNFHGLGDIQNRLSTLSLASNSSTERGRVNKPKAIPPRTCQEPIPTPRRGTLARRSREASQETTGLPAREVKAGGRREPYYKVPLPHPREVTPPLPGAKHTYEYLELEASRGRMQGRRDSASSSIPRKNKKQTAPNPGSESLGGVDVAELEGSEDKFYDAHEAEGEVLIKKTKGIATLADGSKYPCVIVQKKPKKNSSLGKAGNNSEKLVTEMDDSEVEDVKEYQDYTPTPMPVMKNDWLAALEPKARVDRTPKPKEIVDGVLYTSKAFEEESQIYEMGLAKFSLIEPEVFQTYDVCKQPSLVKEATRNVINDIAQINLKVNKNTGEDVQVTR